MLYYLSNGVSNFCQMLFVVVVYKSKTKFDIEINLAWQNKFNSQIWLKTQYSTKLVTLALNKLLTNDWSPNLWTKPQAGRTTKIHLQNCNYSIYTQASKAVGRVGGVDIPRNCLMELSPILPPMHEKGGKYKQAGRCPFTNNN